MRTAPATQSITCSDCSALVPLEQLGDHVCSPPTPSLRGRLEGMMGTAMGEAGARRGKKPSHIDIDAKGYASRRVPNSPGLSPSPSSGSGSVSPSPSALSPGFMSQSTSASSGLSGLSRSSSSTTDSSLHSPLNSPSLHAKLPFFDKYNRVYGETNSPSLSRSPAQQDMATFQNTPQIALSRDRAGSSASSSTSSDARYEKYRIGGFYDRKPALGADLSKSRSDTGFAAKPSAKRDSGHNRARSDVGGGLERNESGRDAVGKRMLAVTPKLSSSSSLNDGLARLGRASPSKKAVATVEALDDLLNDMAFEDVDERETPTPSKFNSTDPRPPSLDAYYFDDGGTSSDEEAAVTPRASAAGPAPRRDFGPARSRPFARDPSSARTVPSTKLTMRCQTCRTAVGPAQAIEKDGGRFCGSCYAERYLPKCRKCKLAIEGRAIGSGDGKVKGKFHAECFNCFACSAPFPNKEFYVFDERPYCALHYHGLAGSLCSNCNSGIEGPCVSLGADEGGRKYHPSCFTCSHSTCTVLLPEFHYVLRGLPYCERHAERRATDRRAEKRRTVIKNVRRH